LLFLHSLKPLLCLGISWVYHPEPGRALEFVVDLVDNPDIETVWVDEQLHREAMQLLLTRQDKGYSLCDAVSFILMRQRGITDGLTTDRHFEQEGFIRLLPPAS